MSVLITFLGGSRINPSEPQRKPLYPGAVYRLPDGREISRLRNALAHGVLPDDREVQSMLADESALRGALGGLLTQLLGPRT